MSFFTKRYYPSGTPPGTLTEVPAADVSTLRLPAGVADHDRNSGPYVGIFPPQGGGSEARSII